VGLAHSVRRSVVFCIAGWYLRRGIHETEEGVKSAAVRAPLVPSLVATGCRSSAPSGIVANDQRGLLPLVHLRRRAKEKSDRRSGEAFLLANTLSLVVVLVSKPWAGGFRIAPAGGA